MAFKAPGNFKVKCNPGKGCRRVPQVIKSVNSEPGVPPPPPPGPTPSNSPTPSVTPTPVPPSPSVTPTPIVTPSVTPSPSSPYGPPLTIVFEVTSSSLVAQIGFMALGTYSGIIDWGDGSVLPMSSSSDGIHAYSTAGTYEVKVYGTIIGLKIGSLSFSRRQLFKEIKQWGTLQALNNSFNFMIGNCPNITMSNITDVLNLNGVTDISSMFFGNQSITTVGRMGEWNTSSVQNMQQVFNTAINFNQDISGWDTSNVTDMGSMFNNNTLNPTQFNQDLSGWCVPLIAFTPSNFDTNNTSWVLPRPVWGTCPP